MKEVFIDGQAGTTGLQIAERLKKRSDIFLLKIPEQKRKDLKTKKEYLNSADLAILCLPDQDAREAVAMIENSKTKILDASTAHRTAAGWAYGLPELSPRQRREIIESGKVANPGCYPTGFLLMIAPLVQKGLISPDYPLSVNAVSGYSGGGRQMIEKYRDHSASAPSWVFRPYALNLEHKHLPEMLKYSGLTQPPLFVPAVGNFERGMLVSVPLAADEMRKKVDARDVHDILSEHYRNEKFVRVSPLNPEEALEQGFLSPLEAVGTNRVDILIFAAAGGHMLLTARLDNLGKGASGAAIQNLNLMLGRSEDQGL